MDLITDRGLSALMARLASFVLPEPSISGACYVTCEFHNVKSITL